jgi:hypothetical protein
MGIELFAPAAVTSRVPFVVSIEVRGVVSGRTITVTLEHKASEGPARPLKAAPVPATGSNVVFASFQVSLHDRGTVVLMATAVDDAGAAFHPDCAVIEVV